MKRLKVAAAAALITVATGTGLAINRAGAETPNGSWLTPITPCRLIDTRPDTYRVGGRGAFGPGEVGTVAVTGAQGNCTIPADATGIAVNLTITDPTAPGYLTLYPAGGSRPNASNINWVAGQAPTANQAVVSVSGRAIDVFNYDGDVNVIIDVHGYYSPSAAGATGAGAAGSPGPDGSTRAPGVVLGTATAYGRVAALDATPTVVGSANVSGVVRTNRTDVGPAAGSFCISFDPPVPADRLQAAVVSGFSGENVPVVTKPNSSCNAGELGVTLTDPHAVDGGSPRYGSFMFLVP